MTGSEKVGSRKFLDSLRYALEGIGYCIKTQRNMRVHLVLAAITVLFCIIFKINRMELLLIINAISMVFICEIINTAVERAVDTATQEYHPIAKIAKDVAAGAVLVAALNSILVGLLVFGRYFWVLTMKIFA
jgi:diacylglycerol kinase (ATP)